MNFLPNHRVHLPGQAPGSKAQDLSGGNSTKNPPFGSQPCESYLLVVKYTRKTSLFWCTRILGDYEKLEKHPEIFVGLEGFP